MTCGRSIGGCARGGIALRLARRAPRGSRCLYTVGRNSVNVLPVPTARVDAQVATEQAGDLARDREAEAGAAVLAARRAVRLLERLEDQALLVLRDADAGIRDRERDDVGRRRGTCAA